MSVQQGPRRGRLLVAVCAGALVSVAAPSASSGAPPPPAAALVTPETALPFSGPVAESAVAVSPRDPRTVVVAGIGFGARDLAEALQIGYLPDNRIWRSVDGGRSFRETGTMPFVAGADVSGSVDPTLAWDPRGPLYAAYLASSDNAPKPSNMTDGLWVARSTDNGARWTGRLAVANGYTGSGCTGPDRPTVAVDPVRGIVWVAYTHLVFTSMPCAAAASTDIRVVRSTDGGRTWSKPVVVASDPTVNPSAAVPAVLPDGSVAVAFLQGTDLVLTQRRCAYYSSVRLATVSQQLKVSPAKVLIDEVCGGPSGTASPGSFQTVPPSPTVAVNPRTGMLAVAASDTSAALPSVRLAVTRDAGKTFTVQNLAVSIGEAPIMPQLAFGAGRFALSYLAALPGSVYRPRLVYSRDDGRTWSDPTELATQPSLGNAKPQVLFLDPFSIGHYQGLAIGPDGVAHAAWPDLRISQTPQSTRTFVRGAKLE